MSSAVPKVTQAYDAYGALKDGSGTYIAAASSPFASRDAGDGQILGLVPRSTKTAYSSSVSCEKRSGEMQLSVPVLSIQRFTLAERSRNMESKFYEQNIQMLSRVST